MPDMLNTSLTGMLAFQRALEVTSHNIANANTPGYSRQVAQFGTRVGQNVGVGYIGSGTKITSVRRMYDSLLGEQMQASKTGLMRFSTMGGLAGRVDSLLANADTGLSTGFQSFFNSLQDLANDPASIPIRQALLGEASGLVNRFAGLDQQLNALEGEVSSRLKLSVDDINRLAQSIADVNDKISLSNGTGQTPNDLLDERDRLVTALAEQVAVATNVQDDGTMSVFIGSGQSLVIGNTAQMLSVRGNEFDPTRLNVAYEGASGSTPLDTSLTGGTLGGLLEFRATILDPVRQSLGQTAIAFVDSFNTQHGEGIDLRGALGGDFFGIDPPTVLSSSNNSGTGSAVAAIGDLGSLSGANYILNFDGAAYSLVQEDTSTIIPMTGTGTLADPFVAGGLEIIVGGAPAAGDRQLIRSTQDAAGSLSTLISDPQEIAMATPTRSGSSLGNTGSATISPATVYDTSDPLLFTPAVIEFTGANSYSINGAGVFLYTDGSPITINGTAVTISGSPAVGDQFTIGPNSGASGDNSNGLLLADIQSVGVLDNGSISINENYSRLVAGVGGTTHQVQAGFEAQSVVFKNVEDSLLSNSGVNLDEEAANLIRFQQAYQAVAQMVAVTNTLFDTLIGATRR